MNTKKRTVISRDNFPSRLPVMVTLVFWLTLDRFNAAQWIYGAVGLLLLLFWINAIIRIVNDEEVDIFENKTKP